MGNEQIISNTGAAAAAAQSDNYWMQKLQEEKGKWGAVTGYSPMFQYTASEKSAVGYLAPGAGSGSSGNAIDIVNDFKWTFSSFRDEVPRIWLIERQIFNNQQLAFYVRNVKAVGQSITSDEKNDPYARLYGPAKKTGFSYIFPYYASSTVNLTQSWVSSVPADQDFASGLASAAIGETLTKNIQQATKVVSDVMGAYGNYQSGNDFFDTKNSAASFGYEQPNYYSGPKISTFTVKFPLYNTDSIADIRRNFDFIKMFAFQNYFERKSYATSLPPVIYQCEFVQGHIGTIAAKPAVYVSRFDAKNVGAIRSIDIGIGSNVLIPEAYSIDITFTELVPTSRNIFSSFLTGQSLVNVYEDGI